jgi:hypothetical protein
MPISDVAPSTTNPHSKSKSGKRSYAAVERLLERLVAFLEAGDFTHSSESRLAPLAPSTIVSYKSFIRKYLEALVQGLVKGHGDGTMTTHTLFIACAPHVHLMHTTHTTHLAHTTRTVHTLRTTRTMHASRTPRTMRATHGTPHAHATLNTCHTAHHRAR